MDRKYTNWDSWFMAHVYLAAQKSRDPKTKIGAVIVRDNNIIATGFNGFGRGVQDLPERYINRDLKRRMVVHGEANAIFSAARLGISTVQSILYTQGVPCSECTKAIIQSGIKQIVVHKQWPNLTHSSEWINSIELSKLMLYEANINIVTLDQVLELEGFLDGKVIKV